MSAYQERNLDYSMICQPKWLYKHPALFYGFWGQCFNDYRTTQPHEGFEILRQWRSDKFERSKKNSRLGTFKTRLVSRLGEKQTEEDTTASLLRSHHECRPFAPLLSDAVAAGPFHIYTSNVDAHFYDFFAAHEILNATGTLNCGSVPTEVHANRACGGHRWTIGLRWS